jgi:hypothetical protein
MYGPAQPGLFGFHDSDRAALAHHRGASSNRVCVSVPQGNSFDSPRAFSVALRGLLARIGEPYYERERCTDDPEEQGDKPNRWT